MFMAHYGALVMNHETLRLCECGNVGVIKRGSDIICNRCEILDRNLLCWHQPVGFPEPKYCGHNMLDYEGYYNDFSPICGESLRYLEQLLVS
jgi:hypothetical protein